MVGRVRDRGRYTGGAAIATQAPPIGRPNGGGMVEPLPALDVSRFCVGRHLFFFCGL